MIDVVLSVVLAMVLTIAVVRLGRICCETQLWSIYGLSALVSTAAGLMVQKVLPRWLVLPEEKRSFDSGLVMIRETWQSWLTPQFGDQWLMGVMAIMFVSSLLLGMFAKSLRTVVGGVVVGAILLGLGCWILQKMLVGSMYFASSASTTSKFAYVVIPALTLCLPWLGWWQWNRRTTPAGMRATSEDHETVHDSHIYLLSVLALTLSGTLLLATSGTLSLALPLLVFSTLPVAWMVEACLPHRHRSRPLPLFAARTSAGWLTASAGLLVILGHLFAEVSLGLACLYAVSLWWVPWLWPSSDASKVQKWGMAVLAAAPALIAAGIAAGTMVAAHG